MKFEGIFKKVRNITILFAVLDLAAAVFFLVRPQLFKKSLGFILAAAALGFGIYRIVLYVKKSKTEMILASDLFTGSALCAAAIAFAINHQSIQGYYVIVFASMLFIGTMIKVQNSLNLRQMRYDLWWIVLILALISLIMSMVLFFRPWYNEEVYRIFSLIFLFFDCAADIFTATVFQMHFHRVKKAVESGVPLPERPVRPDRKPGFFSRRRRGEPDVEVPMHGMQNAADPFGPHGSGNIVAGEGVPAPDAAPCAPPPVKDPEEPVNAMFESINDESESLHEDGSVPEPAPWEQPVDPPAPKFDPETGELLN